MSSSMIGICNLALSRVGVDEFIASLDNPRNNRERDCALLYQPTLDAMLQDFPWNFAQTVQPLALVAGDAPPGWGYQYRYPTDCVRAQVVTDSNGYRLPLNSAGTCADIWNYALCPIPKMPFAVMADSPSTRAIVCDVPGAYLWYTQAVSDPSQFSGLFASAFAWRRSWLWLCGRMRVYRAMRVCSISGRCRRRSRLTRSRRMLLLCLRLFWRGGSGVGLGFFIRC